MASTDARPVPIKNTAFRVYFTILDADGDPVTGAASLDSEVSKDGGSFADCTNEATEISQGVYYLDISSTEMNADAVCVIVKTATSGAKAPVLVFYPQEAGDIKVDVETIKTQTVTAAAGVAVPASIGTSTYAGADTAGTTTLLSRLSSARAGYLDNLSAGAVALEASLQGLITTIGASAAGAAAAVWAYATRILTAGTNIALAKGTGVTGFNDPTAAATATAVRTELATELGRLDAAITSRSTYDGAATLADSVPADGSRPTADQALYAIYQFLTERSVTGTTLTVNKPDGSTALMTFTLDDADAPSSITRAS